MALFIIFIIGFCVTYAGCVLVELFMLKADTFFSKKQNHIEDSNFYNQRRK